jgi:hypothetical protein
MGEQQARDLDRYGFATFWRSRNDRSLGDVVGHRDADTPQQLNAFRDLVDQLGLLLGVFVEKKVELIERVPATCQ